MTLDRLVAEDLEAFAIFAKHRNFTHAADELHVSQPALHARIRKLEQALGLSCTNARAQSAAHPDRRAPGRLRQRHPFSRGRISSKAWTRCRRDHSSWPPAPGPTCTSSATCSAATCDRKLGLRLMTTDSDATVAAVRDGTADVGVTALTIPPDDLECDVARRSTRRCWSVRPDHRLADRRTVRLKDLQGRRSSYRRRLGRTASSWSGACWTPGSTGPSRWRRRVGSAGPLRPDGDRSRGGQRLRPYSGHGADHPDQGSAAGPVLPRHPPEPARRRPPRHVADLLTRFVV